MPSRAEEGGQSERRCAGECKIDFIPAKFNSRFHQRWIDARGLRRLWEISNAEWEMVICRVGVSVENNCYFVMMRIFYEIYWVAEESAYIVLLRYWCWYWKYKMWVYGSKREISAKILKSDSSTRTYRIILICGTNSFTFIIYSLLSYIGTHTFI